MGRLWIWWRVIRVLSVIFSWFENLLDYVVFALQVCFRSPFFVIVNWCHLFFVGQNKQWWSVVKALPEISSDQKNRIKSLYEGVVRSLNNPDSNPRPTPRSRRSSSQFLRPQVTGVTAVTSLSSDKIPLLHLKRKVGNTWEYSSNLTGVYLDILHEIATSGTTFKDKNALPTGVGKGSIGVEVVKGLLSGGAHVVITTSSYSRKTVEYYQSIFQSFGSRGSALTVVPFNQASKQDVEALMDYIYAILRMDLDHILPFAGIPVQVILPLSPNHRSFRKRWLVLRVQDIPWDSLPTMGFRKLGWIPLFGWCSHWVSLVLGLQHFANEFQVGLAELALWDLPTLLLMKRKPWCSHVFCQRDGIQYSRSYASSTLQYYPGQTNLGRSEWWHGSPSWPCWYHNSYPLQTQQKSWSSSCNCSWQLRRLQK